MTPSLAIAELKSMGWTEAAIAQRVGCAQSTVNRIGSGARQPSYGLGIALVRLARRIGRKKAA